MLSVIARYIPSGLLLTCFLAIAMANGIARAQGPERISVPYAFTIGSQQFPAGTYIISLNERSLILQPVSGGQMREMIISQLSGPNAFQQGFTLVFDDTGGGHRLSEVWFPNNTGVLLQSVPKGHTRALLSFSDLSPKGHASGKVVYDLTCSRCHGDKGVGSASADKYFGLAIPRLNSPAVQAKSDSELRSIISQGTVAMPPVEVEESGFRHRIPPQDVDAVIAYLRTLKQ